ncbi:DUF4350 domain-containing protein [Ectobacillus ponti]|uniref:Lamin tail domain-containing protein n=2 Tax=Bacteria TaxID=2 RepID=A0AA41X2S8_9BACI|nr:DUF4350 domain-containing protein [Ectobacillus ponti]MCP8967657.1 lamin tail domain-containing protein [Ectobacillus ponti]
MRSKNFRKWTSFGLSSLLIGGTLLPQFTVPAYAAKASHVVISEVYGGGGSSSSAYKNDYIELYNPTDQDIDLSQWSLQYASSSTTSFKAYNLTGTIKAYGYYLLKGSGSGSAASAADLPVKEDAYASALAMGGAAGKVALVNKQTALTTMTDDSIVDLVAYGNNTGIAGTPAPSTAKSVERLANDGTDPSGAGAGKGNGWDTDDYSQDFIATTPNPQSSVSPIEGDTTPISALRQNDSTGTPTLKGQTVRVEGIVTVANQVLGANSFYIQDASGGINVFKSDAAVKAGDRVKVIGQVDFFNGLTELVPASVQVISQDNPAAPAPAALADLLSYVTAEKLEGTLVTVRGKITNIPTNTAGSYNITMTDDAGKAVTVRVAAGTGIQASNLQLNASYEVTGIVGQYDSTSPYDSGYQLYPRSSADISNFFSLELAHTALTTTPEGADVIFNATVQGADTAKVYYKAAGAASYEALTMAKGDQDQYTAVLPAASVPAEGFVYYIEAKNATSTKQTATADQPHAVQVVKDIVGPTFNAEQPSKDIKVETQRPDISVQINDPNGIDTAKTVLTIDGQPVAATVTDTQAAFTPEADMALGAHTAKVTAYDKKGNMSEFSWSFELLKPFTGGGHYRGTTHNHTNISHDGAGTPVQAAQAGKDHGYDWFAFSDHSHDIDPELVGQDTVDHKGQQERTGGAAWQLTKDVAKQYTKNGEYVVFPAFEMTSTTWGHSNVFGTDNFIDRKMNAGKYQDLSQYYAWVLTYDNVAAQFNHPDMSANAFNNFMPYDKNVDKLFTMLEVGNGSGNYGYANAEKKFYSALDLGWHVAPTYGEDNHDGTWGQTMQRTVIVADDLSQDSLFRSMRNYRVYFEEDPNFKLDMLANGQYMGSVINSKNLSFTINGSDAVEENNSMKEYSFLPASFKSDDRIQSVELITNGGKVVDSIKPNTKDFTWNPKVTVTGGQQWFVVKVTQMDGQRIYSAPVWTKEEPVDVRVSGVEVAGNAVTSGNPATVEAGISNLGSTELANVGVKFYADEKKEANLIGTATIAKIAAKGVGKASAVWQNPAAGSHSIIAVVDTPQGDDPADNEFVKQINVKQSLGITVMIDAAHKNENTSTDPGTYKNNFKTFTQMVQREGYTVTENTKPLTDDVLANVKVLVLTHPQTDLTAEENTAVANFVKNGGALFLADKSNYKNNSVINNDLLEEMGATIRINNDGIFDKTKEGNFWSDPVKSPFAVRMHLKPVNNYITDRADTLEYYSGSSLEKAGHQPLTDSDTVTVLASGNETTYQEAVASGYMAYDLVSDDKGGSAIPAVASETVGKGRIVVTGMNFINDKQLDESYTPKGNDELGLNAINWLADRGTKIAPIADARQKAEGTEAVVEGTVTTKAGTFYDAFYVQDASGGVMAFHDVPDGALELGDKVRIYGHIKIFENNVELEYTDFAKDVIKIGHGDPVQPKSVTTGEANAEGNQGMLVQVTGKVKEKYDDNSYIINDGSGDILVFTDGYIVTQSGPVPSLKIGDTLQAAGLTGKYAKGNRIRVRDTKELVRVKDVQAPVTTAQVDPAEPNGNDGWYKSDVTITLSATDDMSGVQQTAYRVNGGEWQAYTAPIVLADGTFSVEYRSVDNEGNTEDTHAVQAKADKTAPVVTATALSFFQTDAAIPAVQAADAVSGVAKTVYKLDGRAIRSLGAVSPLSLKLGSHTLLVTAEDIAGNKTQQSFTLEVKMDAAHLDELVAIGQASGWITKQSTALSMLDKIKSIQSATGIAQKNQINALQSFVRAQTGKSIDTGYALLVTRDLQSIREQ